MPYAVSDGARVYFESAGDGPALLLTHGYGCTSEMWKGQTVALAGKHRVIRWDIRGHGLTDSPEDQSAYSEATSVADMRGVLDACHVDRAVIGGLSLGGYLSLAFHYAHRDRVRGLILCDTGPGFRNPDARAKWNQRAETWAQRLETKGLTEITQNPHFPLANTHRSASGLAKAARGIFWQTDAHVIESLAAIRVPTLVVVGANDALLLEGCKYMAAKIPGATLVVVPDAGHYPNIDQPAIFDAAVGEFLQSLA